MFEKWYLKIGQENRSFNIQNKWLLFEEKPNFVRVFDSPKAHNNFNNFSFSVFFLGFFSLSTRWLQVKDGRSVRPMPPTSPNPPSTSGFLRSPQVLIIYDRQRQSQRIPGGLSCTLLISFILFFLALKRFHLCRFSPEICVTVFLTIPAETSS